MSKRNYSFMAAGLVATALAGAAAPVAAQPDIGVAIACAEDMTGGLRPLAQDRLDRFLGKGTRPHVRCNGGNAAVAGMSGPWVDWRNYWGAGDASSRSSVLDPEFQL